MSTRQSADHRTRWGHFKPSQWGQMRPSFPFGPRRFYERTVPEAPEGIGAILKTAAGDLDGDGRDDLVLAQDNKIDVLRAGPTGVPGTATPHELAYEQRGVAVGDVDGDHRPDIATADSSGAVVVLRNRGLRPQSRPTLVGPPVLIGADRSLLVDVRCSAGVGHCYGDVSVRTAHRSAANGFDIRPGARARVPVLIGGLRAGSRVTLVVRGLGSARQRVRTLVRGSGAADRRRSCRPAGRRRRDAERRRDGHLRRAGKRGRLPEGNGANDRRSTRLSRRAVRAARSLVRRHGPRLRRRPGRLRHRRHRAQPAHRSYALRGTQPTSLRLLERGGRDLRRSRGRPDRRRTPRTGGLGHLRNNIRARTVPERKTQRPEPRLPRHPRDSAPRTNPRALSARITHRPLIQMDSRRPPSRIAVASRATDEPALADPNICTATGELLNCGDGDGREYDEGQGGVANGLGGRGGDAALRRREPGRELGGHCAHVVRRDGPSGVDALGERLGVQQREAWTAATDAAPLNVVRLAGAHDAHAFGSAARSFGAGRRDSGRGRPRSSPLALRKPSRNPFLVPFRCRFPLRLPIWLPIRGPQGGSNRQSR